MNNKELIEEIENFIKENRVSYNLGETWCVMLHDKEKSEPIMPFLKKLKEESK